MRSNRLRRLAEQRINTISRRNCRRNISINEVSLQSGVEQPNTTLEFHSLETLTNNFNKSQINSQTGP